MSRPLADDPGQWVTPPDVIERERRMREGIDAARRQREADLEAMRRVFAPTPAPQPADAQGPVDDDDLWNLWQAGAAI